MSPSAVFRYFPAKEDIVRTDECDPVILEELRTRPAEEPWTESVRRVIRRAVRLGVEEDARVSRPRTR